MTASNTVFTVFSGIGFIISLIPLPWHLEAQNVGTCLYMIWTALACLTYFVNSIVWSGNTTNWAPVWCDISMFTHLFRYSILTSEKSTFFSCSHPSRCCRRLAHLWFPHRSSPLQYHFPYRWDAQSERGALSDQIGHHQRLFDVQSP